MIMRKLAAVLRRGLPVIGVVGALLLLGAVLWAIWGWFANRDDTPVTLDRAQSTAIVRQAQVDADRSAARDKALMDMADAQARAAEMEAINASLATPDGDPLCAVLECVRGKAPATPAR